MPSRIKSGLKNIIASSLLLHETNPSTESSSLHVPLSWTAHHSKKSRRLSDQKQAVNCMLPVIDQVFHDKSMQHHLMTMNLYCTQYLNPGQTAVTCGDQPLDALKKQLFWECHDRFSNSVSATHIKEWGIKPTWRIFSHFSDLCNSIYYREGGRMEEILKILHLLDWKQLVNNSSLWC